MTDTQPLSSIKPLSIVSKTELFSTFVSIVNIPRANLEDFFEQPWRLFNQFNRFGGTVLGNNTLNGENFIHLLALSGTGPAIQQFHSRSPEFFEKKTKLFSRKPIHYGLASNDIETIRALFSTFNDDFVSSFSVLDSLKNNLFHYIASFVSFPSIFHLIQSKATQFQLLYLVHLINVPNSEGWTPLALALASRNFEIVSSFLEFGASHILHPLSETSIAQVASGNHVIKSIYQNFLKGTYHPIVPTSSLELAKASRNSFHLPLSNYIQPKVDPDIIQIQHLIQKELETNPTKSGTQIQHDLLDHIRRLTCSICFEICIHPTTKNLKLAPCCKRVFCTDCLQLYFRKGKYDEAKGSTKATPSSCPWCQRYLKYEHLVSPNISEKTFLSSLKINCPFYIEQKTIIHKLEEDHTETQPVESIPTTTTTTSSSTQSGRENTEPEIAQEVVPLSSQTLDNQVQSTPYVEESSEPSPSTQISPSISTPTPHGTPLKIFVPSATSASHNQPEPSNESESKTTSYSHIQYSDEEDNPTSSRSKSPRSSRSPSPTRARSRSSSQGSASSQSSANNYWDAHYPDSCLTSGTYPELHTHSKTCGMWRMFCCHPTCRLSKEVLYSERIRSDLEPIPPKIPRHEYSQHTLTCSEQQFPCTNTGCPRILRLWELTNHMQQCPFRQLLCSKCNETVSSGLMEYHLLRTCLSAHKYCDWRKQGCLWSGDGQDVYIQHMSTCLYNTVGPKISELENRLASLESNFISLFHALDTFGIPINPTLHNAVQSMLFRPPKPDTTKNNTDSQLQKALALSALESSSGSTSSSPMVSSFTVSVSPSSSKQRKKRKPSPTINGKRIDQESVDDNSELETGIIPSQKDLLPPPTIDKFKEQPENYIPWSERLKISGPPIKKKRRRKKSPHT